jgi:hypothetical protein
LIYIDCSVAARRRISEHCFRFSWNYPNVTWYRPVARKVAESHGQLSAADLRAIEHWSTPLLDHWEERIGGAELVNRLQRLPHFA